MKRLNLQPSQRERCTVTYNINRFEVYLADGCFVTAASTKADLKVQLAQNGINGAMFDRSAQRKYLAS
jgi:hypothetical protein